MKRTVISGTEHRNGGKAWTRIVDMPGVTAALGRYRFSLQWWGYTPVSHWANSPHAHSQIELAAVHGGRGFLETGGETFRIEAGDILLSRPGETHRVGAAKGAGLGLYFCGFNILPPVQTCPRARTLERLAEGLMVKSGRPVRHRGDDVLRLFEIFGWTMEGWTVLWRELAEACGRILIAEFAAAFGPGGRRAPGPGDEKPEWQLIPAVPGPGDERQVYTRLAQLVASHSTGRLVIGDIARTMGTSVRTLQRVLKTEKTTFRDLSQDIRLDIARHLLVDRRHPIKWIAKRTGYSDQAHFTAAFQKRFGLPPHRFRRNLRA